MTPQEVYAFARQEVFPTLEARYEGRQFSRGLWKKMAGAGLFGFLIPNRCGGSGKGPVAGVENAQAVRGIETLQDRGVFPECRENRGGPAIHHGGRNRRRGVV